jgi:hypothetical protein
VPERHQPACVDNICHHGRPAGGGDLKPRVVRWTLTSNARVRKSFVSRAPANHRSKKNNLMWADSILAARKKCTPNAVYVYVHVCVCAMSPFFYATNPIPTPNETVARPTQTNM